MQIPPFVKKFDFRGIYNKDIKDQDAYYLGLAIQKTFPLKKILIGWDTREASFALARNFIQAFQGTEIEINYIEKCPIDYITVGSNAFDFDFSVMFTGSHNSWDWSGLLMHTAKGASVEGELVDQIVTNYYASINTPYVTPNFHIASLTNFKSTLEEIYRQKMKELIPLDTITPKRIVVDLGDGSGAMALDVLEALLPQVTFDRLNTRPVYDKTSRHTADPSNIRNMEELISVVRQNGYDAGFAFDSDADRMLAVDETGEYINGSLLGGAMIQLFAKRNVNMKKFGYAVECGPSIFNTFADVAKVATGIELDPIPVGRSILRRMIREGKVDFAVENVGHFYIKDFFMTDSGTFSIAVILSWMSENGKLSTLIKNHPDGRRFQSHFAKDTNSETKMHQLIDKVNEGLTGRKQKRIMTDGVRYEFYNDDKLVTWYALRPSGYEPIIKYYYGSLDDEDFTYLANKFAVIETPQK